MVYLEVAMILFSCVAANHLGLVRAVEKVTERELPIVNCPRCLSFWCVIAYMTFTRHGVILSVATSFLCAALAPWVKLAMGFTDFLYDWAYDKIYSTEETAAEQGADHEERP